MAHYAELNENNEVIYVAYMGNEIITDENGNEVEELGIQHLHTHHGADRRWVRTSYSGSFRGKYAGLGDTYREDLDMFISPQPFASWILNETTGQWEAPIIQPELTEEQLNDETYTYYYFWDEETQSWALNQIEKPTEQSA
jgi:ketosteroid isomerase-like protein